MKTARKAGFKPKSSSKRQKYVLPTSITNSKYLTSPGRMSLPLSAHDLDDDLSCKYSIYIYYINLLF